MTQITSTDPCSDCGHCCAYFRISFPWIETSVYHPNAVPISLVSALNPQRVCMKGTESGNGRCVALSDSGRCTIYEKRPSVCREFRIWDAQGDVNPDCSKVRQAHGLQPHEPLKSSDFSSATDQFLKDYKESA